MDFKSWYGVRLPVFDFDRRVRSGLVDGRMTGHGRWLADLAPTWTRDAMTSRECGCLATSSGVCSDQGLHGHLDNVSGEYRAVATLARASTLPPMDNLHICALGNSLLRRDVTDRVTTRDRTSLAEASYPRVGHWPPAVNQAREDGVVIARSEVGRMIRANSSLTNQVTRRTSPG